MSTTPLAPSATEIAPAEGSPLLALVKAASIDRAARPFLIGATLSAACLVALFWQNLSHFVYTWSKDENYSHGYLVPFLSLYFANEAARRGRVDFKDGSVLGIALLGLAVALRLLTVVLPVFFISDLAFLLALAGGISLLFGWGVLRRYWFAVGFLIFMIPLPIALYAMIASPLQLMVSRISSGLLNLSGVPAICEGNMITLPGDIKLFVAEACSGMRQLTGFLALTTACAYLLRRPKWFRLILVACSIPIAMTANVIRVTLTGEITYHLDPKYASGLFHTIEGLLMMGLGLMLLQGVRLVLEQVLLLVRPEDSAADASPVLSAPTGRAL